jgi:small subunit ribosomal protein S16
VAVKIRLKRLGKIRAPYYRIVVADSRTKRDGRVIEEIGKYHPTEEPSLIEVDSARAQYWLGVGAQPSEQVLVLLKITGDWQTFKGLPGTEGTLRTKATAADAAVAVKAASDAAEKAKAKAAEAREKAAKAEAKAAEAAAAEAAAPAEAEASETEAPVEIEAEAPAVAADEQA